MPKIIKDLKARLMEEAKHQIEELGYSAVTIRSVAKSCGVGVGTVYNYFLGGEVVIYRSHANAAGFRHGANGHGAVTGCFDLLFGFLHQSGFQVFDDLWHKGSFCERVHIV